MRTIKITQTASEKFAPDCAEMVLRLSCEHKKYSEAVKELAEQCERVKALLTGAGLKAGEIVTGGSAVDAVMREGKKLMRAHTEIKTSLPLSDSRLHAAFDAVEASGLAWSQTYSLKDDAARTKVLKAAVERARSAAETIAAACGTKVGNLQSVEYASQGGPVPMRAVMVLDAGGGAAPESIEVSETVTCEWEVE